MKNASFWSLKPKLIAMILLVVVVAVGLTTAAFYMQIREVYHSNTMKTTRDLAEILAISTQSALLFDDPFSANQSLESIQATPEVKYACIFTPSGQIFTALQRNAAEQRTTPSFTDKNLQIIRNNYLDLYLRIERKGELLGVLYLYYDLTAVHAAQRSTLTYAGVIITAALVLAFILATRLQGIITSPLGRLCDMMARVRDKQDYRLRTSVGARDEIGLLSLGFNEMLQAVQQRDGILNDHIRRTDTIIETIPGSLLILDSKGFILEVLTPLRMKLFHSKEELTGKSIQAFVPEDEYPLLMAALSRVIKRKEPQQAVFGVESKEGKRWFEAHCALMPANDSSEIRLVCIIMEITQRKLAEEQLLSTREELHQAQKMESIGHLAGGVAHDFNNQLSIIMGYSDIMGSTSLDPDSIKKYSDNIRVAAKRSADLTRHLLAFARKGNFQTVPVDMNKIVGEVVEMLHHCVDKKIKIRQQFDAFPAVVTGDPSQLQNAVLNLGINARDAMPNGGELLFRTSLYEVDSRADSQKNGLKPGPHLLVEVVDTGTGIPPEVMEHIFEPFYTTKEIGKGTGMGLAAVYGTLQSHQGVVTVDSRVGAGTTFSLFFPVPTTTQGKEAGTSSQTIPQGKGYILIIDDEVQVAEMAATMLKALGYSVFMANGGRNGIALFQEHREKIRLVLLDMVMPEMSGKETAESLRAIAPEVKLLISSGHNLIQTNWTFTPDDRLGFIQKPYLIGDLARRVDEELKR